MYRKITCFFFSCFLIVLYSFVSMADNSETLDISGMEDGGAEIGQNDFLGSQDHVGDSHVDNEGVQNFVETSPDSMEFMGESSTDSAKDALESSQADVSENGGLLDENEIITSESNRNVETSFRNEKTVLETETALSKNPEDSSESGENSTDAKGNVSRTMGNLLDSSSGREETLIQSYMNFQDSPEGFSNMETEDISSSELYIAVLECRDFLESCMYLLVVDTVLLSLLLGCLCCSIFSRFLRWWK